MATLAEPADPTLASPAKKPKRRAPKATAATAAQAASSAAAGAAAEIDSKAKAAKPSPKGKAVKPKGRKKAAEAPEQFEPAELLKGPAFAFEVDHVLALGSRCGLPTDRAARDAMSAQHQTDWRQQEPQDSLSETYRAQETANTPHPAASGGNIYTSRGEVTTKSMPHGEACSPSPTVPVAELPLRDRLHKIQQLLLQAGLSPAQALLVAHTASNSDPAATATAVHQGVTAASEVRSVRQQSADIATIDLRDADLALTRQQSDSSASTAAASPQDVTKPAWSHGVTYDELICLVSPSPAAPHQRLHASQHAESPPLLSDPQPLPASTLDSPQSPHAMPSLLHWSHADQSPGQAFHDADVVSLCSPQQVPFSVQPASPIAPVSSEGIQWRVEDIAQLDLPQELLSGSMQSVKGSEPGHGMPGNASSQPSTVATQHTKKRGRYISGHAVWLGLVDLKAGCTYVATVLCAA